MPDLSCNSTGNCNICPFGYSLLYMSNNSTNSTNTTNSTNSTAPSTQNCVMCDSSSKCARCSPMNTIQCTSCLQGSWLNSNMVCQTCPFGCTNCLSASQCLQCGSGFVALLQATIAVSSGTNGISSPSTTTQTIYQPVTCSPCKSPCVTCYNNPMTCMSCISGYTLNNNICLSNFNYGFSVTLNVASSSTFVNNYYKFLLQIANSINTTISNIAISKINYSSTSTTTLSRLLAYIRAQSSTATATGMISTSATSMSP